MYKIFGMDVEVTKNIDSIYAWNAIRFIEDFVNYDLLGEAMSYSNNLQDIVNYLADVLDVDDNKEWVDDVFGVSGLAY